MSISTYTPMMDEILTKIDTSPDPRGELVSSMAIPYFKEYIELSVSDKFPLIDILSIQTKQYGYHRSMAGAILLNRQTWNLVSSVIMSPVMFNGNIITKQYKAISEMLHSTEFEVLNLVLTKNLSKKYPNITHELICDVLGDANEASAA